MYNVCKLLIESGLPGADMQMPLSLAGEHTVFVERVSLQHNGAHMTSYFTAMLSEHHCSSVRVIACEQLAKRGHLFSQAVLDLHLFSQAVLDHVGSLDTCLVLISQCSVYL